MGKQNSNKQDNQQHQNKVIKIKCLMYPKKVIKVKIIILLIQMKPLNKVKIIIYRMIVYRDQHNQRRYLRNNRKINNNSKINNRISSSSRYNNHNLCNKLYRRIPCFKVEQHQVSKLILMLIINFKDNNLLYHKDKFKDKISRIKKVDNSR